MFGFVATKLEEFEQGKISRRRLIQTLTAAATALGLGLLVFVRQPVLRVLGAAILVLPHLVGAPLAPHGASALPAEVAAEFATASLATAALFWLLLGGISGWLYRRFE